MNGKQISITTKLKQLTCTVYDLVNVFIIQCLTKVMSYIHCIP